MSSEGESTQTDRSPCKGKSIMNGYFRLFRATVRFPDTRNKEKKDKSDSTCIGYSSTPIGLLQYSLLDYSSTCIGLLQYFYWITPVLLSESIKVLSHASPPTPFPRQLVYPFPRQLVSRQLVIIYLINLSASLLCDDGFSSFEIKIKMFFVGLFWYFFLCDGYDAIWSLHPADMTIRHRWGVTKCRL